MTGELGALLTLLSGLTLVLVAAHVLGLLADRLGSVPVVGELLTGLVLGPSALGVLAPAVTAVVVPVPAELAALASLGLVLVLVLAGTEVDAEALRRHLGSTTVLAARAWVVPFLLGVGLGWVLPERYLVAPGDRLPFALFLGTALSISAVPVAVRVLVDLGAMERTVGQLTVTVAVVVDAAGWIALTVAADVAGWGSFDPAGLARTVATLLGFVAAALLAGRWVADRLFAAVSRVRSPALTGFSLVVVSGIAMAGASLALGLEPVVGAFLAGILVGPRMERESSRVFQMATLGFFAPIFFATAGLRADLHGLWAVDTLVVGVATLAVAVLGKFLGVAVGAAFTDLTWPETACIAVGLNARGAMEIVVAAVGLSIGVLTPTIYAVIVLVAIATSVMTPPLLRRALARLPDEGPTRPPGAPSGQ